MHRGLGTLVMTLGLEMIGAFVPQPAVASPPTAERILEKALKCMAGNSFETESEFEIVRDGQERDRFRSRCFFLDGDKMLLVYLDPPRIRNQAILRNGDNQWLYFPDLGKAMKVNRSQRLQGSDFSFGDILELDLRTDYTVTLLDWPEGSAPPHSLETQKPNGLHCNDSDASYLLELRAKRPGAGYDKVLYRVRRSDYASLCREYYTKSGILLKYLQFREHDIALAPKVWEMHSALNRGVFTRMRILSVQKKALSPQLFTLGYLKRSQH